jgi:hypothetical protein
VRLYLDLCCLNRPFDDQTQPRVSLEAQAVILILQGIEAGGHQLCNSTALIVENSQNPKVERRRKIGELLDQAEVWIPHSAAMDQRVLQLAPLGFHEFDAYHVASAEAAGCDRLVTCDDRFLQAARRHAATLAVLVTDPIGLISEAPFR